MQAAHTPQASTVGGAPIGLLQLSNCAVATATNRFPTPEGPENIVLGGSDRRSTDRASNATSRLWPTISLNAMRDSVESYHASFRQLRRIC
jgi:hypothetical protein